MDRSQRSASGCGAALFGWFWAALTAAAAGVAADAVSSRRASSSGRPRGGPRRWSSRAHVCDLPCEGVRRAHPAAYWPDARAGSITLSTEASAFFAEGPLAQPAKHRSPRLSRCTRPSLRLAHGPSRPRRFHQAAGRRLADDITCVWGEGLVPSEGRPAASQSALPAT